MKKLVAFTLTMSLALASLAACDAKTETKATEKESDVVTEEETTTTTTAAETKATEAEPEDDEDIDDEDDIDDDEDLDDEEEDDEDEEDVADADGLMMYQFDKDNMDVDLEDEEFYSVEEIKNYGTVKMITENGLTFYEVDDGVDPSYFISKEDYENCLTEVDVTLDNFDEYFELVEEEIWDDNKVEFRKYFQLKDDYLFAMVDYDHLYENTADATCRPIDYESTINVEDKTYDWGGYDVRHDEIEIWIDFSETDEYVYKNVIVSTYPDNYIEDNGDETATGVAHEDLELTDVSIKFYYLKAE